MNVIENLKKKVNTDVSGKWIQVEELDKFADLIVRECSLALSPMLRDMVSRGQAFDLIKQHFGVEE
jgi:uncharacterized protein Yka (UPF0111/DUF47 family)